MKSSRADSPIRIDMLNGGLFRKILMFALPLMASGILQQSFNSIDVAVVGRFASSQALAAVGSNGMIISIMVNLFLGISVGANVVISNYIGQRNEQGIRKAVRTVSFIALWSGLLLLVLGVSLARPILELMNTPHDVIDLATLYLRIYFLGMPFMMIYNFGAAILRSMGDTKRPFYSLIAAGIINTGLNLVLVIGFEMSVAGVAIATVASNIVSASIIVFLLLREKEPFRLEWKKITVERNEFRHMLRIGVPAGVQGMVFSFANIFVQSSINGFGSDAVAGSAAALNYEYYCFFVISAFAQAAVAFVSQNYGAGQIDRCKKAFRQCMFLSFLGCGLLNGLIVWQKGIFIGIFTSNPDVFHYAALRLQCVLLFQFLASSYEISGAALRGYGYSMTPTVFTIFGTCVLRLVWIYTVAPRLGTFDGLLYVYPLSWVVTGIAVWIAYAVIQRRVR